MACKDKNDTLIGMKYRSVVDYGGGSWVDKGGVAVPQGVYVYAVSYSCMHCSAPACLSSCPTGAIIKREQDGIVYIDAQQCIGCGTCVKACPYGAPRLNSEKGIAGKCDFCKGLLAEGGNPACVDACLMRCLEYGEIDELRGRYGDNAFVEPLAKPDMTGPNYIVAPSRLRPANGAGMVINTEEELL
jgi:anaerobic dimethyl sulfoxide reductase subunit B (iron-sulfur subunit)